MREQFIVSAFDPYPFTDYLRPAGWHIVLIGRIFYEKFVNNNRQSKGAYIHMLPTSTNIVYAWEDHEKQYMNDVLGDK